MCSKFYLNTPQIDQPPGWYTFASNFERLLSCWSQIEESIITHNELLLQIKTIINGLYVKCLNINFVTK